MEFFKHQNMRQKYKKGEENFDVFSDFFSDPFFVCPKPVSWSYHLTKTLETKKNLGKWFDSQQIFLLKTSLEFKR